MNVFTIVFIASAIPLGTAVTALALLTFDKVLKDCVTYF